MFFSVLLLIGAGWGMVDNERARRWYLIVGLVLAYGLTFGLTAFLGGWVGIAPIIVLCATLYTVYLLSMESTRILEAKIVHCASQIEKAKQGADDPSAVGSNVPLLTAEKKHCETQCKMLWFVQTNHHDQQQQQQHVYGLS